MCYLLRRRRLTCVAETGWLWILWGMRPFYLIWMGWLLIRINRWPLSGCGWQPIMASLWLSRTSCSMCMAVLANIRCATFFPILRSSSDKLYMWPWRNTSGTCAMRLYLEWSIYCTIWDERIFLQRWWQVERGRRWVLSLHNLGLMGTSLRRWRSRIFGMANLILNVTC